MRHPDDHPQPPCTSPGSPGSPASGAFAPGAQTRDDRLLSALLTTAFVVLLAGALLRYVLKHGDSDRLPWIVGLSVVLAVVQVAGQARPGSRRAGRVRLAVVVACWVVVVLLAPSFAWCAVPLIHTALRLLPTRSAVALVTALATLVVLAELRLADGFDPNHLLLPRSSPPSPPASSST